MKQMSFADAKYASKRKQVRRSRARPNRDGSGGALEGLGYVDRTVLSKG